MHIKLCNTRALKFSFPFPFHLVNLDKEVCVVTFMNAKENREKVKEAQIEKKN